MRAYAFNAVLLAIFVMLGLNCTLPATNQLSWDAANHHKQGNYDLAIRDATEAIKADSTNVQAYWVRADSYVKKENYELAVDDYNTVLRLRPGMASRLEEDGSLYLPAVAMRAQTRSDNGNYDGAIEDYNTLARLRPGIAMPYNGRAWVYAYHLKRDFDRAIADANQAIKIEPNNANYYDTRGWAYLGKGDYNSATDDFFKALKMDPNLDSSKEGLKKIREAQAAAAPEGDSNEF